MTELHYERKVRSADVQIVLPLMLRQSVALSAVAALNASVACNMAGSLPFRDRALAACSLCRGLAGVN
ncbi:hypothetical protein A1D31_37680 [Bradyrhizobium liaoningense]|nr:hypothetical protein A1D31_37680 [Bradyrhizobium liaoningense]